MPHATAPRLQPHSLAVVALSGLALACALAATPSAAQSLPHTIAHRVTLGDTLEQLALRYLGDATLWPGLQSHNRIDNPYRLQQGSILEIPLQLMRTASASVDYVQGTAHLNRSGTAAPVARGMPLQEGDQLQLDPDAFVAVRLADGSTVRVQASSLLELRQLRRRGRSGSLQSVLEVQQGGVEVQVPGQADPQRRLEVLTPVAATSVRGTQFDVQLLPDGRTTTAVLEGRVAMQPLAAASPAAPHALLKRFTGMSITADGRPGAVTALLPAVAAQALPSLNADAQWLQLPLPAWEQAASWRVVVSEDAQGQRVLRNGQFAGPHARFAALPDGAYFLHVRAVDAQGINGIPASAPLRVKAHPVPPLLQAPAPAEVLTQGQAQLQCTPVQGAHSYHHQVIALPTLTSEAPASAFAQPLLDNSDTQCALDLRSLPSGTYAWRASSVRLVQGQEDPGPFAAAHAFRIAPQPATPSLDAAWEETPAGYPSIHWTGEPGQRFRLQAFATPEAHTTAALDQVLDAPQWTASELPAGTWHVRIQVQDPSGLLSEFSPLRSVQVLALVRDGSGQPLRSGTGLGVEHR